MHIVSRKVDPTSVSALSAAGVPDFLARLYSARGVSAKEHANTVLLSTGSMHNAEDAADIIAKAVLANRRILIVSDYDADGATACTVGMRTLNAYGANAGYLVPQRLVHGYGLTPDIVKAAAELTPKPDLIITVDNGISSVAGVRLARELGIEVIVTDHHLAPDELPNARLIVDPNQPDDQFESKSIAGCGVMWYVMQALEQNLQRRGVDPVDAGFTVESLLPIVAIGTIADVVSLDRNNRILVKRGLDMIRTGKSFAGINALAMAANKSIYHLSASDIAFGVGPRINAAGRLAEMDAGIECLLTDNRQRAFVLASVLHDTNEARKDIEQETVIEAVMQAMDLSGDNRYSVVAHSDDWHQGVIGIVAGRVREKVYRPTFALTMAANGEYKGSGRSIPGFHLRHALDVVNKRAPGLLKSFGGHAAAAGITVRAGGLAEFIELFEDVSKEGLTPAILTQELEVDGSLPVTDISLENAYAIKKEVWGQGFAEPVFFDEFDVGETRLVGKSGNHLQMRLHRDGQTFSAIRFRHEGAIPVGRTRLAYKLEPKVFNGTADVQLMVDHID